MYEMKHHIVFTTQKRDLKLQLFESVVVTRSVENLVDTAVISLPESVMNRVQHLEEKIERGAQVRMAFGYDVEERKLPVEFVGYVLEVVNTNGHLEIRCEDALFLFRKSVENKQFKPAPVKAILQYLIDQVDSSFSLVMDADYSITYEKFTIHNAEAYDVLKKIQEELKANIYFDTEKKELHFHAPYKETGGEAVYDMSRNIESSSLEYQQVRNRKLEVVIQSTSSSGQVLEVSSGTTGGEKVTLKVGAMPASDMKKVADMALVQRNADRYEGDVKGWLNTTCRPAYRVRFKDDDYRNRNGLYYVTEVITSFSEAGGSRTVKFGIKL